jgi:4-hydroxybenzoate polyprenyltransferase
MKYYIKLLRPKHWIKNFLVFSVLVFSGRLFDTNDLITTLYGALAFSFISSTIYIINDIRAVEMDKKHEIKCKRPIASGIVSIKSAWITASIIFVISIIFNMSAKISLTTLSLLLLYFFLNILSLALHRIFSQMSSAIESSNLEKI